MGSQPFWEAVAQAIRAGYPVDDSFSKEYGEQLLGEWLGKLPEAKDAFKIQDIERSGSR